MASHLLLRLEGPLMSFGTLAVDQHRPVQRWPAVSMITGLLGNALGWRRTEPDQLDRLQARLRWAARIDRPGTPLEDFQTAQLDPKDKGWTTRGRSEARAGGAQTYNAPHIRYRDYRADASVVVALRLDGDSQAPTLADLAAALRTPMRPLFLGRKACPPSQRLVIGLVDAVDALEALDQAALADQADAQPAIFFNEDAATHSGTVRHRSSDERRFTLDVHAGAQWIHELVRRPAAHPGA